MEASKLRKRVEELVRDNEALKSSTSSFASSLCMGNPVQTETQGELMDLYNIFSFVLVLCGGTVAITWPTLEIT